MKLTLLTVGRLKRGPERDMIDAYLKRVKPLARQLGYRDVTEVEVVSGGGRDAEADRILAKIPEGAAVLRLDEHGKALMSVEFSRFLAKRRDQGVPEMVFLIGGAEGYGERVRQAATETLAFGPQTWPHRLVKVMLVEQVYRALSIEAGSPYHKA